ncbi:MAG: nucleotidyl transferase AbiEii/AbiGii toxin family protein [Chloroflexota bacterium]
MATLIQSLEYTLNNADPNLAPETKRILLKTALQSYVLDFLYNHPHYRQLNFYGGTCLQVVYSLNRLSEDLDLDNGPGIDLSSLPDDLWTLFQKTYGHSDTTVKTQQGKQGVLRITLKLPVLNALGLSPHRRESLHLKVETSHHQQVAIIQHTPVFYHGRSFVPSHFSLETMMAGKILACLERNFQRGRTGAFIKGRDFYDLLWFMQQGIQPLEEKLAVDGSTPYTIQSAMDLLADKIAKIQTADLAVDLLPMFESRIFIETWLEHFHVNFERFSTIYKSR